MAYAPDCQQQRTFLMRMYFGAEDERNGFIARAYRDLSRTVHGLAEYPQKQDMKASAADSLRSALSTIERLTVPSTRQKRCVAFDRWHERSCGRIITCFPKLLFSHGQAQKWINMTVKYRWWFGNGEWLNGWIDVAHIPVDNRILGAARERAIVPCTNSSWSRWSAADYKDFQEKIRNLAWDRKMSPLALEHHWWMQKSKQGDHPNA
jgi:hypothetical protein